MRRLLALGIAVTAGCNVTPLTGKITPGDEAFLIVVGEGDDGTTDLFAAPANGGAFYRLTYSRPVETAPAIGPDGRRVAFLRQYQDRKTELVVLDLGSMSEVRMPVSLGLDHARLGWSERGDSIAVGSESRLWIAALSAAQRTAQAVPALDSARVDSLTRQRLGSPVFAVITGCRATPGWCATSASGETALAANAGDPFRWGPDAVAYLAEGRVEVRPLGGGATRSISWKDPPRNLRQPTYHPGPPR